MEYTLLLRWNSWTAIFVEVSQTLVFVWFLPSFFSSSKWYSSVDSSFLVSRIFWRIPYLETQKLDYCQSYKDRAHAEPFCYQLICSHFNLLRIFQSANLLPYWGLFGRTSASWMCWIQMPNYAVSTTQLFWPDVKHRTKQSESVKGSKWTNVQYADSLFIDSSSCYYISQ